MIKYCGECGADLRETNGICYNCASKNKFSSGGVISLSRIKEGAKELLDKHFGKIIKATIFVYAIMFLSIFAVEKLLDSNMIFYDIAGVVRVLIFTPLFVGLLSYILKIVRDEEVKFDDLFKFYDRKVFLIFAVGFLISFFSLLWGLLFIIPGVIAYISYSLSNFVLIDNENMSAMEILEESKRLTDGYKGDIFALSLSFVGWFLLSFITFGIALIYVLPYVEVTFTMYYEELKKIKQ